MSALPVPSDPAADDLFDRIARALGREGRIVVDDVLPAGLADALFARMCELGDEGLERAGIGREEDHRLNRFVRGDETRWLEPAESPDRDYLAWIEELRLGLNRRLFLGLFDYEAHYARYAPGSFYSRHLDAFAGAQRSRVLTTVLYLNPTWQPGDGGELLMYDESGEHVLETITPCYGRLAVFLSERFPHEVLPTKVVRHSIAGWFRVNGSLGGTIDPPR